MRSWYIRMKHMKLKVYVTKIYSIYRMRNGIVAIKCDELYGNELLKNREIYLKQKDYNYLKKRGYYRIYI